MTAKSSRPLMGRVKFDATLDFRKVLNSALRVFFKDALRVALTNPSQAWRSLRTLRWQQKASRLRSYWMRQGVHVPPILIFSITSRCNLQCKGCYNWALRPSLAQEMEAEKLRSILAEAKELGISFDIIAGGEPLVRPEILDITGGFPEMMFLVFTNGLLLTDEVVRRLARQRNFVPVISLEGQEVETDGRRGKGVYRSLRGTVGRLAKRGLFWSVSMTVTRANFDTLTSGPFIEELIDQGCRLFFFIEYTPVTEDTEDWLLTDEQRKNLLSIRDALRSRHRALFIAIPGDEEEIGGCLSAGRGFIHINAAGDVEPCPFAPYSDANLRDMSLKDALRSGLLQKIRENHGRLSEAAGGCALWAEREWVRSLLPERDPARIEP